VNLHSFPLSYECRTIFPNFIRSLVILKTRIPKAKSQGTYTFALPGIEIACSLFSVSAENAAPTLHYVHAKCTAKPAAKKERDKKPQSNGAKLPRTRQELICARCSEPVLPEELGKIIRTVSGEEFLLTSEDVESLDFKEAPRLDLRVVNAQDEVVHGVGFDRRLYAIPLPTSAHKYWTLLDALRRSRLIGFMQIVIKGTAYPAVLRPMEMPFLPLESAEEISTSPVLVVDCLNGSQNVRPLSLVESYDPEASRTVTLGEVVALTKVLASHESEPLTLADCVDPRTNAMLRMLRRVKRRFSLRTA
jgi:non-homologous end joining protein Ku